MRILLVRHCESAKNLREAFSSNADDEPLTDSANSTLDSWARSLGNWVEDLGCKVSRVHCTASRRSIETAAAIGRALAVPSIAYEKLRSPNVGALAGVTARAAAGADPNFIEQLRLYRLGLFNARNFTVADGRELQDDFERRVDACVDQIVSYTDEDLKVIVSHRAPITAILLSVARRGYGYPANFSGYVALDLGHVSLLEQTALGHWCIRGVNLSVEALHDDSR
jgi:broad specificity phosphatase PhoE